MKGAGAVDQLEGDVQDMERPYNAISQGGLKDLFVGT